MTKQEEIREVIDLYTNDACLYKSKDCESRCPPVYYFCNDEDSGYKCLMERLTEIGVVLKVASVTQDLDCHYQPAIVSVESLILPRKDTEPTFNNSAKE